MSAFDSLRAYLESKGPFTKKDLDVLERLFVPVLLDPGAFLQRAGEPIRHAAFVAGACFRSYVVDAKGDEVTLELAPDNYWIGDRTFLTGGTTCECFIDSIGRSQLLLFDQPSHQKMVECVPTFAAMFRVAFQKYAAAKDRRIINALSMSRTCAADWRSRFGTAVLPPAAASGSPSLGEEVFEAALSDGQQMTPDAAVAYALRDDESEQSTPSDHTAGASRIPARSRGRRVKEVFAGSRAL